MTSIIRQATRAKDEPLNILTFPTHERYETGLCMTGHNFYAYRAEGIKDWNTSYGTIPDNYILLNPQLGFEQIPDYVEFDLVLSQNKFGQFQLAHPISQHMQVPLVSLEHTLPVPNWTPAIRHELANMRGDMNVFISEYSIDQWRWQANNDTAIIHHMVDTDVFCPMPQIFELGQLEVEMETMLQPRHPHILSVVNDWINREWCCNFKGWQRITKDLPVRVIGDTPGLSKPAPTITALVNEYQQSLIFLNTSTISPVPTALLEAMACGCACVSTATCMIPEIIEDGVNGFISNDEKVLRERCMLLLKDPELARNLGHNARKTIEQNFHQNKFINSWNTIFRSVL
jgi:hypothetical protein